MHVKVAVADQLIPISTDITHVNERIMRLSIHHTMSVIFLVCVYAQTRVIEFSVKEAYVAQLQMVEDSCPEDILILSDFNATTSTDMYGYLGHHGSGSKRNLNSSTLREMRISVSLKTELAQMVLTLL